MLFQSDYWISTNEAETAEIIHNFLEAEEGTRILVIVDTKGRHNIQAILRNYIPCTTILVTNTETRIYDSDEDIVPKTIHLRTAFDESILTLINNRHPILAICL